MDDLDPPQSPRKKPKLAHETGFNINISATAVETKPDDCIATEGLTPLNDATTTSDAAYAKVATMTNDMTDVSRIGSMDGPAIAEGATHADVDSSNDQLTKEAACGITEFVSPDLLGFSGTLKKR